MLDTRVFPGRAEHFDLADPVKAGKSQPKVTLTHFVSWVFNLLVDHL